VDNVKFFYCYNKKLSQYLNLKGFRYITKARSIRNLKVFYLYILTDELKKTVDEYYQEMGKKKNNENVEAS